jgi:hypothetical protein
MLHREGAAELLTLRLSQASPAGAAHLVDALVVVDPQAAAHVLPPLLDMESAARRLHLRKALSRLASSNPGQEALRQELQSVSDTEHGARPDQLVWQRLHPTQPRTGLVSPVH